MKLFSIIKLSLLISLIFHAQFLACFNMNKMKVPQTTETEKTSEFIIPDEWNHYGAFYEKDLVLIEAKYHTSSDNLTLTTKFTIERRMKIFNSSGMDYATVKLRKFSGKIKEFNVKVLAPDSTPIKLNVDSIKRVYEETGGIVFPRAEPGSVLDFTIQHHSDKPMVYYTHWFTREIPVRKGVFNFYSMYKFDYDIKEYPCRYTIKNNDYKKKSKNIKGWEIENILPSKNSKDKYISKINNPHVSLALRKAFDYSLSNSWSQLTNNFRKNIIPNLWMKRTNRDIVKDIEQKCVDPYKTADSLLHWVQENITVDNKFLKKRRISKITDLGTGNIFEIAATLHTMYKSLNLQTDIIMTKLEEFGKFDEDFVSLEQLHIPVVTVDIGSRTYAAEPYLQGGKLGQYQLQYHNKKGLSILTGAIKNLPDPLHKRSTLKFDYFFESNNMDSDIRLKITIDGSLAYLIRNYFFHKNDEINTVLIIAMMKSFQFRDLFNESNIEKISSANLDQRGEPFSISITFHKSDHIIERGNQILVKLDQLLNNYYIEDLVSDRQSLFTYHEIQFIESFTVNKTSDKKYSFEFTKENLVSDLFKNTFKLKETGNEYILTRNLTILPVKINKNRMKTVQLEVNELIKKSDITLVMHY